MLDDPDSIDMMLTPAPGLTMLVINDFFPWPDPEAGERLERFRAKLNGYSKYVASDAFTSDHPQGDRAGVVISVLTLANTPPSIGMRAVQEVWTQGETSYQILVQFAEDSREPAMKPWWKFW
jgi:hypothetical protein